MKKMLRITYSAYSIQKKNNILLVTLPKMSFVKMRIKHQANTDQSILIVIPFFFMNI